MVNDEELYKYYMSNWQNCGRYSMAEFIHKLYSENQQLKLNNSRLIYELDNKREKENDERFREICFWLKFFIFLILKI